MEKSNDMEHKQKFENNVNGYLEALDKIQIDLVKMLDESMKLNEILQEAISQLAKQYLEHDNQRIPSEKNQWRIGNQNVRCQFNLKTNVVNFL